MFGLFKKKNLDLFQGFGSKVKARAGKILYYQAKKIIRLSLNILFPYYFKNYVEIS